MAKASAAVLKFEIDDDAGLPVDITQYIDDIGGHAISEDTEETTPFGTTFREHESVGVKGMDSFAISGFFDDADPGPATVIGDDAVGSTRTVTITYKTGSERSFDVKVNNFEVTPQRSNLTRWSASLQPTGELTGLDIVAPA